MSWTGVREKRWLEQARSREGDREASGSVEWLFHRSVGQTTKLQHTRIGVQYLRILLQLCDWQAM
jgi:hypothetical protein